MTRPLLRAASGAALLLAAACVSAQPKRAPAPVRATPTIDALKPVFEEISMSLRSGALPSKLDALTTFRFTPSTASRLRTQFGTEHLFKVTRVAAPAGQRQYAFTLLPLQHTSPEGTVFAWSALDATLALQADGKTLLSKGAWPRLDVTDGKDRLAMRQLTYSGDVRRGDGGIWYGDDRVDVASVEISSAAQTQPVRMHGLSYAGSVTEQATTVGMRFDAGIGQLEAGGDRIDDIRMALRLEGIDKQALQAFAMRSEQLADSKRARSAGTLRKDELTPLMRDLGRAIMTHGASVALDDLHLTYRGSTARVSGRASLDGGTEADLAQPERMLKKIAAHLEMTVPLAMLRAFTDNIAHQESRKQPTALTAAQLQSASQRIYEHTLQQVLASGYVTVEGDNLVATVDVRDGVVLLNGKPVDLPKPGAPVAALDSGAAGGRLLRARRIADKCVLPDYPEEVIAADSALSLSMRMTVQSDGSVTGLALARSSGRRDYDNAVLAAAARCTWIPALRDGQPVAVPTTWDVTRTPGSVRP